MSTFIRIDNGHERDIILTGLTFAVAFGESDDRADARRLILRLATDEREPDEALVESLVEAALRFTFRNTLRPQSDADEKLYAVTRAASAIQQARHPDRKWDTGI